MSVRELVVLGTASQVPTRHRNHNGFVLRWDGEAILFDPGEGTQRQMSLTGVASGELHRICLTHLHGDHCLGLPGVLARLSLDQVPHPVTLHHPASGAAYVARLRHAAIYDDRADVREASITSPGVQATTPRYSLTALPLDHRVDAWGYRLEEPEGVSFLPDRLEAAGVHGPRVAELAAAGELRIGGRTVRLDEVAVRRPGQVFAFVMDTRVCDAAVELARGADLVVCESTFLDDEADLAARYAHLTARQAATIAREAGARRLVLAHFSQRHPDAAVYGAEAAEVFPDVVVAEDGLVVPVPRRHRPADAAGA